MQLPVNLFALPLVLSASTYRVNAAQVKNTVIEVNEHHGNSSSNGTICTVNGHTCHIPFTYMNETRHECAPLIGNRTWCLLKSELGESEDLSRGVNYDDCIEHCPDEHHGAEHGHRFDHQLVTWSSAAAMFVFVWIVGISIYWKFAKSHQKKMKERNQPSVHPVRNALAAGFALTGGVAAGGHAQKNHDHHLFRVTKDGADAHARKGDIAMVEVHVDDAGTSHGDGVVTSYGDDVTGPSDDVSIKRRAPPPHGRDEISSRL